MIQSTEYSGTAGAGRLRDRKADASGWEKLISETDLVSITS
jgi:hypothetical protein